ncbi:MAG: hypothetical protein KDK96_11110 [Chlamydiia bacterium]|nr:hypothetical protein [Chlamydiia bacterium]
MADAIKPNKDFWTQASETYNDVTTSKPWRHTIGRISMLARIPIYLIALGLQTAKIVVKTVISPLGSFAAWAFNTSKLDAWTFSGVGRDCLIWVKLLDKIGSSSIGVIAAPPKQYYSFFEALKSSTKIVLLGSYHNPLGDEKHAPPCSFIAELVFTHRAQYSQLFFENASICNNKTFTMKLRNAIKAG